MRYYIKYMAKKRVIFFSINLKFDTSYLTVKKRIPKVFAINIRSNEVLTQCKL